MSVLQRIVRAAILRIIGKRLLQAIPVVWGVTFLIFTLMNLLPGGSAQALAGDGATPAQIAAVAHRLHLDEPFWTRYWHWATQALQGHLGASLTSAQPVSQILGARLPVTAEMVVLALGLATILSIPLAVLAVRKPHGIADRIGMLVCICGLSMPPFVIGLIAILIFAVAFHLLPAVGFTPLSDGLWPNLKTMIMPSATLGFALMCHYTRVLRADMLDQLNADTYVVTAEAKGIRPGVILLRHVLRNSMFGFLTLIGLNLGVLIGGTVLIEQVFAIPGMGQELIQAVEFGDVTSVEAIVVVLSLAVVATSLLTDLLYVVLDPRIRYGRAGA